MKGYRTREVADLVGMSPPQIRAFARRGILRPSRGPRRAYYFTFQDLVLLRTAKGLRQANISAQRVGRVLRSLAQQLPDDRSLTEVAIVAMDDAVIAHDRGTTWNPESGQVFFPFSPLGDSGPPTVSLPQVASGDLVGSSAERCFQVGVELEISAPQEAREAYDRALMLDPGHVNAHINIGRLDQEEGNTRKAIDHYTAALISEPTNSTAAFNLGSALELIERYAEALSAYEQALHHEPTLAEAHYRLALLHEHLGRELDALRHLKAYRALVRSP